MFTVLVVSFGWADCSLKGKIVGTRQADVLLVVECEVSGCPTRKVAARPKDSSLDVFAQQSFPLATMTRISVK
jgi:hypothetical protein